jgi:mannose-6-phosphate isomerase-like protein (cupin superfamily)
MTTRAMVLFAIGPALLLQQRKVDPTWLHRDAARVHEEHADLSSRSCHYRPVFGAGDADSRAPRSVARFGELEVEPHGTCDQVEYPRQEELYFILGGSGVVHYGSAMHSLSRNDFTYVPPMVRHDLSNPTGQPLRVVLATVRIPPQVALTTPPPEPTVANLSEVEEQPVQGHPTSVLYKLLIGPRTGTRDRINATYAVADFFLMDFASGGTNFPHHHEVAEEIYLVLDGEGQMVAGGGMDGIEGRHPARAGDAYYFRPNCTVGFYNQNVPGAKAHILALRAFIPPPKNPD